jgi:predicted AAA+ superfamily ATPase
VLARVRRGGYPEMLTRPSPARQQAWFSSYLTTLLERDVREMSNVENLSVMPRLLALLAARTASLLNYSDLARSLSLPQTTLKRYVALLEAAFLVQLVPPWYANVSKRLVRSPKLMLSDTGVVAHLLGLDAHEIAQNTALMGQMLENFVAMELRKQSAWARVPVRLYHFRAHAGEEVDVVLEGPAGRLVGIEVKASSAIDAHSFDGLRQLAQLAGKLFLRGIVLYAGSESVSFGANMAAMPISALWRWPAQQS